MNNYKQSNIGFTETMINVHSIKENNFINIDSFVRFYKISKIFKGKFFLKRLIKKIFKYKIYTIINWRKSFWNDISVVDCSAKLSLNKDISTIKDIEKKIIENCPNNRIKSIYKYKNLIKSGQSLGAPLYITGNCLNYLGSNVKENEIYMLDGSRRLVATLLADVNQTKLFLIKLNNEK